MVRLAKPVRFSSHASRRRQLLIQPAICLGHLELGGLNWQPILISPIHPIQSGYTQPLITIILLKPKSQIFNQERVATTRLQYGKSETAVRVASMCVPSRCNRYR